MLLVLSPVRKMFGFVLTTIDMNAVHSHHTIQRCRPHVLEKELPRPVKHTTQIILVSGRLYSIYSFIFYIVHNLLSSFFWNGLREAI
jgi:hypothetical protein